MVGGRQKPWWCRKWGDGMGGTLRMASVSAGLFGVVLLPLCKLLDVTEERWGTLPTLIGWLMASTVLILLLAAI